MFTRREVDSKHLYRCTLTIFDKRQTVPRTKYTNMSSCVHRHNTTQRIRKHYCYSHTLTNTQAHRARRTCGVEATISLIEQRERRGRGGVPPTDRKSGVE